jgi:hypothetical protein
MSAIKEEACESRRFSFLAREGLYERAGIERAEASTAEQSVAVFRCVQIGRKVSRYLNRAVFQAGTSALRAVPPARARRISCGLIVCPRGQSYPHRRCPKGQLGSGEVGRVH